MDDCMCLGEDDMVWESGRLAVDVQPASSRKRLLLVQGVERVDSQSGKAISLIRGSQEAGLQPGDGAGEIRCEATI